jgi:hypothetical protein
MSDLAAGLTYSGRIVVTPVLTVHANYVANDYVGTSNIAMTFAGAARVPGGTGYIQSAVLVDAVNASIAGELWMFDTIPTPPADSAAWTITDALALGCLGVIPFSTYYASALNSVSRYDGWPLGFKCLPGSTNLYGCYVTRGAPAYAATGDISFKIVTIQD